MSDPLLGVLKITRPAHIVTVTLGLHSASIAVADKLPAPKPPQPIFTYYLTNGCPLFTEESKPKTDGMAWRIQTHTSNQWGTPICALTVALQNMASRPQIKVIYHREQCLDNKSIIWIMTAPANQTHIKTLQAIATQLKTLR